MLDRLARRWYVRLGRRYKFAALATQVPASVLVALGVVGVLAAYYHPSLSDALIIAGATSAFTAAGVSIAISRQRHVLAGLAAWGSAGVPTPAETIAAWDAATNFPRRSFRRNSLTTNAIATLPSVAVIVIVLGLPLSAFPVLLAAAAIAAAFGTIVTYSIAELLMRPVIEGSPRRCQRSSASPAPACHCARG